MRIGKILIAISISILLLSFLPFSNIRLSGNVEPNEYRGRIFGLGSHVWLDIETTDNQQISVFILDWNNSMLLLGSGSMHDITPVVSFENTTGYSGRVEVPLLGLYSIVVATQSNETVQFDVDIDYILPQYFIFLAGVTILLLGVLLIAGNKLILHKRR
ncbi:MAG: hypothetical protein ACTSR9_16705 [Candidatus Thorarchaeota archaeon]